MSPINPVSSKTASTFLGRRGSSLRPKHTGEERTSPPHFPGTRFEDVLARVSGAV